MLTKDVPHLRGSACLRKFARVDGTPFWCGSVRRSSPGKAAYALTLLAEPDRSTGSIVKLLGISRVTLYQHLPKLKAAAAVRAQALRQLAG